MAYGGFEKGDIAILGGTICGRIVGPRDGAPGARAGWVWFERHKDSHRFQTPDGSLTHPQPKHMLEMFPKLTKKARDTILKKQLERHEDRAKEKERRNASHSKAE